MSRKREGSVRESRSELLELFRLHHRTEFEPRLRMLSLLSEGTASTLAEAAERIGCSERTARRWWKSYQEEGIAALLRDSVAEQPRVVYDRRKRSGQRVTLDARVQEFLNSLPTTSESFEWIRTLRAGLINLLGDVDHAIISVNLLSWREGARKSQVMVMQHAQTAREARRGSPITSQPWQGTPGEMIYDEAMRHGFPADEYRAPIILDFHSAQERYVGTIILLRLRDSPPISRHSLALLESLRPFFTFLFNDCVVRHALRTPSHSTFTDTISSIAARYGLTRREGEVLLHQMLGRTYDEIAAIMEISAHTVSKYIVQIHAKTGMRNMNELFTTSIRPARSGTDLPEELEHLSDLMQSNGEEGRQGD